MPLEPRISRLERIAKLFVREGLRMRRDLRELDDKFKMLVNMQMENAATFVRNEKRFARYENRFARNEGRLARNEERLATLSAITDQRFARLAQVQIELAESQARTDRKLGDLIDIVRNNKSRKDPGNY